MSKHFNPMKSDTMMYVSQLRDKNGNVLADPEGIAKILAARKDVVSWAYIIHDKDTVTQDDVDERETFRKFMIQVTYCKIRGEKISEHDLQDIPNLDALEADALREAVRIVDESFPSYKLHDTKTPHVHFVIQLDKYRKRTEVARWFNGVGPTDAVFLKSYTDRTGDGARYKSAMMYLVHKTKNAEGKYQYDAKEVVASFDYTSVLDAMVAAVMRRDGLKMSADDVRVLLDDVCSNKLTIEDIQKRYPGPIWVEHKSKFENAEEFRLKHAFKPPKFRMSLYFDSTMTHKARVGKTTGAFAVAAQIAMTKYGAPASLFDTMDKLKRRNDYIFIMSPTGGFNGYNNQPIIIMDDCKASTLKSIFSGRDGIKLFLDPHPADIEQNIKYRTILLSAEYVLISGIAPFHDFIKQLSSIKAGGEETADDDIEQFYGRFWGRVTFTGYNSYRLYKNREMFPIDGCPFQHRFYSGLQRHCALKQIITEWRYTDKEKLDYLARKIGIPVATELMTAVEPPRITDDFDKSALYDDTEYVFGAPDDSLPDMLYIDGVDYDDYVDFSTPEGRAYCERYPEADPAFLQQLESQLTDDHVQWMYTVATMPHKMYLTYTNTTPDYTERYIKKIEKEYAGA